MSLDYSEICDLIYEKKSEESLNKALSLLSEPAVGIEEALRYLYMRDACYRLGEKEKVIEYGQLSAKYAEEFFENEIILNCANLQNQCKAILSVLQNSGMSDIEIEACVGEETDTFRLVIKNAETCQDILIPELKREIEMKISKRQREERYLYYRAAAGEISGKIRETVSNKLYGEIVIETQRTTGK